MSQRAYQQVGTLTWVLEWKNSLSVVCFICSLDDVLVKMGAFDKHSLLVQRISLDPSGKKWCPFVRILGRYIIAYRSAFVEDEAVIVLIMSQNKMHLSTSRFHWQNKKLRESHTM